MGKPVGLVYTCALSHFKHSGRLSAHLHHVDNSVRVLHVVLGLADFHANGAGEALAPL